jgi:hypothetical protein
MFAAVLVALTITNSELEMDYKNRKGVQIDNIKEGG